MIFNIINSNNIETIKMCIMQMKPQDFMLFMGEAVNMLTTAEIRQSIPKTSLVLEQEAKAKAVTDIIPKSIKIINYDEFAQNIILCQKSITWN